MPTIEPDRQGANVSGIIRGNVDINVLTGGLAPIMWLPINSTKVSELILFLFRGKMILRVSRRILPTP